MKKAFIILLSVVLTSACSVQAYVLNMEMRYPSASGLDVAGKDIAVVYFADGDSRNETFCNYFADGLAQGLEASMFNGEKAVNVYTLNKESEGLYASKDSLVSYVLQTGSDVVMLLDTPVFSPSDSQSSLACKASMYIYDSMDKHDSVKHLAGESTVSEGVNDESLFNSDAQYMGLDMSKKLASTWKEESLILVYFDAGDRRWISALESAYNMNWKEAMDTWIELTDSNSTSKQSCAAYNVAVACYVLGQYDLASEWLEQSEKIYPTSLAPDLRAKIEKRR